MDIVLFIASDVNSVPYLEPRGRVDFDSGLLALACTAAKRQVKVEEYRRYDSGFRSIEIDKIG